MNKDKMQAVAQGASGTLSKNAQFDMNMARIACVRGDAVFCADNPQAASNKFALFFMPLKTYSAG